MNDAKPKTVFDERDGLKAENAQLRAENATLRSKPCPYVVVSREGTYHCSLAEANGREIDAARKLAAAAVHYFDVDTDNAEWDSLAFSALDDAVAEYRALTEASLSHGKQAVIASALDDLGAKVDKAGELLTAAGVGAAE